MTKKFFIAICCLAAVFAWGQIPPQIQLKPVPQIFVNATSTNQIWILTDNNGNALEDNNTNQLSANP